MIKNATATTPTALAALQSFVSRKESDPRPYVKQAFATGLHAYGTDGWTLIRVPLNALDDTSGIHRLSGDWPKGLRNLIPIIGNALLFGGDLVSLPTLLDPLICQRCLGNCYVQEGEDCDECDGDGEFEHGSNWYDCKACDGTGKAEIPLSDESVPHTSCPDCDGQGEARNNPVPVGAAHINRVFLARIAALPNARIATPMDATSIVYFTSDFGDGAVMPTTAAPPIRYRNN